MVMIPTPTIELRSFVAVLLRMTVCGGGRELRIMIEYVMVGANCVRPSLTERKEHPYDR
jgi:hypothetical protein